MDIGDKERGWKSKACRESTGRHQGKGCFYLVLANEGARKEENTWLTMLIGYSGPSFELALKRAVWAKGATRFDQRVIVINLDGKSLAADAR